jgi:hypothetical protein
MFPDNPVGLKVAVPFPLSVTPVPVQTPLEFVGVPVSVMLDELLHIGP